MPRLGLCSARMALLLVRAISRYPDGKAQVFKQPLFPSLSGAIYRGFQRPDRAFSVFADGRLSWISTFGLSAPNRFGFLLGYPTLPLEVGGLYRYYFFHVPRLTPHRMPA